MRNKTFYAQVLITLFTASGCDSQDSQKPVEAISSTTASSARNPVKTQPDLNSKAADLPIGKWWFPINTSEISIVSGLRSDRIYRINPMPIPDVTPATYSNVHVKKEQSVINLGTTPLHIYQGGTALIEAKNISLVHADGSKTASNGAYTTHSYSPNEFISGSWRFNGNPGPVLIADLNTARNFRLFVDKYVQQQVGGANYTFRIYVDGTALPNLLINTSSIDVYGSKIAIELASYPPVTAGNSFEVHGSYNTWQ
jgi:hypothetical protein